MVVGFGCYPLSDHDRAAFTCGVASLDDFIRTKARKENRRFSAVFVVAPDDNPSRIAGYYSLSAQTMELTDVPLALQKKMPRYPIVPVTLLARLAVSTDFRGRRLGEELLMDALKRAYNATTEVGSFAVVVDPIDDAARTFYERYEFAPIEGSTRMVMQMATIAEIPF